MSVTVIVCGADFWPWMILPASRERSSKVTYVRSLLIYSIVFIVAYYAVVVLTWMNVALVDAIFVRLGTGAQKPILIRWNCTSPWGYMCTPSDKSVDNSVAEIACKHLGYPAGGVGGPAIVPTQADENTDASNYGAIAKYLGRVRCSDDATKFDCDSAV